MEVFHWLLTVKHKHTEKDWNHFSRVCMSLCMRMWHCSDLWWPYGYCAQHFSSHLLCIKELTLLNTHLGGLSTHTLIHAHKHTHASNRTIKLFNYHIVQTRVSNLFALYIYIYIPPQQQQTRNEFLNWKSFSIIIKSDHYSFFAGKFWINFLKKQTQVLEYLTFVFNQSIWKNQETLLDFC